MAQYKANLTTDSTEAYSQFGGQVLALTMNGDSFGLGGLGYPGKFGTYGCSAYRWKPEIAVPLGYKIIINSAYLRLTSYPIVAGDGSFISKIEVYNGTCPDLLATENNLVYDANWNPTASHIDWNLEEVWEFNTEYTSPNIASIIQEFYNREDYDVDDYIGIRNDAFDAGADEMKAIYLSNVGVAEDYKPELEINYILVRKNAPLLGSNF